MSPSFAHHERKIEAFAYLEACQNVFVVHCVVAPDCVAHIVVVDYDVVVVAGVVRASGVVVVVVVASFAVDEIVGDLVAPSAAHVVVPLVAPPDVVDAPPLRIYLLFLDYVVVVVVDEVAGNLVVLVVAPPHVVVSALRMYAMLLVVAAGAVDNVAGDHVAPHAAHVDALSVVPPRVLFLLLLLLLVMLLPSLLLLEMFLM